MSTKYKVIPLQGDTYQVIVFGDEAEKNFLHEEETDDDGVMVYQGRLADCEAYIRLKKEGYM